MKITKKKTLFDKYLKIEKQIGSLKFALIIISLFTVCMITGTLLESTGGVEIAAALIYKNPLFMLLQFCMLSSILMATFQRFPLKKRLAGFYVIHAGLIIIGCGSLITYLAGIDGSIFLAPNTQTREINLNNLQIKISMPDQGINAFKTLPNCAFECNLNSSYKGIKFKTYLPFADKKLTWVDIENKNEIASSAQYRIQNGMVSQIFTMSLNSPDPDFGSQMSLGPLTIFYLPPSLASCFNKNQKSGYIFWNSKKKQCFTPEDRKIDIKTTSEGTRFVVFKEYDIDQRKSKAIIYAFFPDFSPWPYDKNQKLNKNSDIRVFSLKMFQKKPLLFLFGKKISFYDKDEQLWRLKSFDLNLKKKNQIELPWMGFELSLLHFDDKKTPSYIPTYVFPKKVKNRFIHGGTKAVSLEIDGKTYWITDTKSGNFNVDGKRVNIFIGQESLYLPYQFVLDKFVMKKNPGTNMPASYESFVTVLDQSGPKSSHVYMNNPLKKAGFTFYQASYSQNSDGSYNSSLSANLDPGRSIKYLGSILLVLGAIWHFGFAKRKKKAKTKIA